MIVDNDSLNEMFNREFEKLKDEVQKPGILLAGATGVGKSSLVNMIFGPDIANVGIGKPVTQKIDCFESPNSSVRLYDSKGYEMNESGDEDFLRDVIGMVKNPSQHAVNIIWYCISSLGARFTQYDENALKKFSDAGCPVAVVLTKADNVSEEDMANIKKAISETVSFPIFETSTILEKANQINSLVEWSADKLPEQLKNAFIAQQKCNFAQKRKRVQLAIAEHVTGAGLVAFSPIPFSDAPVLAGNEVALMARILSLYDLGGLGNAVTGVGLYGNVLTLVGKSMVGGLLKFIPGVGQILGGAINASVAVAITWAFGGAVALACEQVWKAKLNGENVDGMLRNFGNIVQQISEANIRNKKTSRDTIFN